MRRCRWPGVVLVLAAATGSARAQRGEGGELGSSSRSVQQGALQPFGGPAPPPPTAAAPPLPKPPASPRAATGATRPSTEPAAGPPSALMPPPTSYMSSAWSFWPHAWAYVPSLWSTWYHDFTVQSAPTTPSAAAGAESPPSTTDGAVLDETLTPAPPKLTAQDSQGLPPPRLVRYRRYNLVIAGTGLLAATWAADRLLARDLSNSLETWVPLVGPWFLLGEQSGLASPNRTVQALLVFDGLVQGAGLTMALLGFVLTTKRYQVTVQPARNDLMPREAP